MQAKHSQLWHVITSKATCTVAHENTDMCFAGCMKQPFACAQLSQGLSWRSLSRFDTPRVIWESQKKIARMVGETTEEKIKGAVIIWAKVENQECDKSLQMEKIQLDIFF